MILQWRIAKYSFQAFWRKLKWNMINNFASLYKTASTLQVWINVELLCCDEEQGLLNPEVFNLIHRGFSWESISSPHLSPLQVGSWSLCANKTNNLSGKKKKKKVWERVETIFSCLCYLKIRRRLHTIWAVRFPCITKCFAGCRSAMTSLGTLLAGGAAMQRLKWRVLFTHQFCCKTWEQNFSVFPIHKEQSWYFSV